VLDRFAAAITLGGHRPPFEPRACDVLDRHPGSRQIGPIRLELPIVVRDIGSWLGGLGLERYAQAFRDNDIDAEVLPELTDADLEKLGVSLGHRRKILRAVAQRHEATATVGQPAEATPPAPVRAEREAERRQLTLLFCDLVGSTELARRLDPEDMSNIVRDYQAACAEVIERWAGQVAKFMGDGVLAYFGWPSAHEDDGERAVRAGLELTERVPRLDARGCGPLAARIGIATGEVVVGELIGEGFAREEAVVGQTPNLAARLQAMAGAGAVVIAAGTRRLLGQLFELEDLGTRQLQGFAEPVQVWRVIGEGRAESRFEALHGRRLVPLVGREHELGLLLERWERATDGEGQVVLLAGEPGIGKSRIVQALRERLADTPYTPLSHYCSPYHSNSALYPVIGLLVRAAGFERDDSAEQRLVKLEALLAQATERLDETVPLIAWLLGVDTGEHYPPLSLTPQQQKQRTLDVLLGQLEGLAREKPVLAVYEDVHWIDPTTLEELGLVIARAERLPVLVVVTYRPEFGPPWRGFAHVTQLSLSRLARRHGQAMVERVTAGKALPGEVMDHILTRTDGVPLFVEELTKTVLESGLLRDSGQRYELSGALAPLAIPSTLQDSLMARLDRLAPVKELAQIGACIGREFPHALIAAVSPLRDEALDEALERLVRSELVFRRGQPPNTAYGFKHALVQDAAYSSLLKSRRQQLHARIAEELERRFPDTAETEPETLAHHLTEAGLADKAIRYWLKAGQHASSRSAHKEAINHLRQGLEILETQCSEAERAQRELDFQIALGAPLLATKGFASPEVEIAYSRAHQLGRNLGHNDRRTTALRGLCYLYHVRGRLRRVDELSAELLEVAGGFEDKLVQADAHNAAGFNLFHLGKHDLARDHLQQSLAKIEQSGRASQAVSLGVHIGVFCRAYAAHCDWHLGYSERAVESAQASIDLARRLAHPFSLAIALAYAAMLHQFRQESAEVRDLAQAALAICSEHGFSYYRAWAEIMAGWADAEQGEIDQGITRATCGLRDLRATGAELRLPYYLGLLAELSHKAGRADEAASALSEAMAVAQRNEESWNDPNLHMLKGRLLGAATPGEDTGEEDCLRQAIAIAAAQGAISLVLRATVSLARLQAEHGRRTEAHDLLAPVYGGFTEGLDTSDLAGARSFLRRLSRKPRSANS
jgi:predicted ATPase/class 3 adenylate cyclase